MPTFNAEKYLYVAIKSIQGQTYKNWELNIIDDTDINIRTLEIINSFKDIRIRYFKGPQKNLAAALNSTTVRFLRALLLVSLFPKPMCSIE